MNWILDRLKERSTWVSIITLASMAGLKLSPELREQIITGAVTLVSIIFAVTADYKARKADEPAKTAKPAATTEPKPEAGTGP